MATEALFRADAYLTTAEGRVTGHMSEGGLILDRCLFYPASGGQPGDKGTLDWDGGRLDIADARKGEGGTIILVPGPDAALPPLGVRVVQSLDWDRRHRHMRVHTALHLLSVVVALPVTGGQIGQDRGRLDFDMPEPPADPDAIEHTLNALVARDLPVGDDWITDEELAANPGLVKTMSVRPPVGQGRVRLVRIGQGADQVDLQPCGGTHVRRTGEIGPLRLGKVENKGRQNRRITVFLGN